jgi:uncharacterized protein (DUF1684 family)
MRKIPFVIICLLILNSNSLFGLDYKVYKNEMKIWDKSRIEGLLAENGWVNLIGLLWLKDGSNSLGSGKDNDLIVPSYNIANYAGKIIKTDDKVILTDVKDKNIKLNGKQVKEIVLFHKDSTNNPMLECKNLRWTIIKRDNDFAVRLRDIKSPLLKKFKGIKRYNLDTNYIVKAKFIPHQNKISTIPIQKMNGKVSNLTSSGKLEFSLNNQKYTIDVLDEEGSFFLIFGDKTNDNGTYPSGRFIYVDLPDKNGETIIDFNKAYNPPCAFTEFANCPLPPEQNILPIAIKVGEKYGK